MQKKVDETLEKISIAGELFGRILRKIFTKQFMLIIGIIIVVIFGTITFIQSTVDGAAKRK